MEDQDKVPQSIADIVMDGVYFNTEAANSMSKEDFIKAHSGLWPDLKEEDRTERLGRAHGKATEAMSRLKTEETFKIKNDGKDGSTDAQGLGSAGPNSGSGTGNQSQSAGTSRSKPGAASQGA